MIIYTDHLEENVFFRFAKARSPPIPATNSITTTNYNKMKMKSKFEYSLLSDGIGDSLMEVDQESCAD